MDKICIICNNLVNITELFCRVCGSRQFIPKLEQSEAGVTDQILQDKGRLQQKSLKVHAQLPSPRRPLISTKSITIAGYIGGFIVFFLAWVVISPGRMNAPDFIMMGVYVMVLTLLFVTTIVLKDR